MFGKLLKIFNKKKDQPMPDFKKTLKCNQLDFGIMKTLGQGASCKVKLGQQVSDQEQRAIKLLKDTMEDGQDPWKLCQTEIETMDKLEHPNVVKQISHGQGIYTKNGNQVQKNFIALEICQGGELFDFICHGGAFSESVSRYYFHQFMEGLSYCHSQNVCHRDLKPENLLLDKEYNLKIADFGFGSSIERTGQGGILTTTLGTPGYQAPEQLAKKPYDGKSIDIFASGVILFTMVAQHPPFTTATAKDNFYKYIGGNRPDLFWKCMQRGKSDGYFSDDFKDLVQRMIANKGRITMEEIKNHAWYTNTDVPTFKSIQKEFQVREQKAKAVLEEERQEKRQRNAVTPSQESSGTHRGKIEDGTCFKSVGEDGWVDPKKDIEPYQNVFLASTAYFSNMNPDDLEKILSNFLKNIDDEASNNLVIKEDKYKMKYSTIQDQKQGPIDVTIQVYKNDDEDTNKKSPYVVEFIKGERGSKQEFLKYFDVVRVKCFEEGQEQEIGAGETGEKNEEEKE